MNNDQHGEAVAPRRPFVSPPLRAQKIFLTNQDDRAEFMSSSRIAPLPDRPVDGDANRDARCVNSCAGIGIERGGIITYPDFGARRFSKGRSILTSFPNLNV